MSFQAPATVSQTLGAFEAREGGKPLNAYAARILSQFGEDGITYELLRRTGSESRRTVEIGAGSNGGNTGALAWLGYEGLFVDRDEALARVCGALLEQHRATVVCGWVSRENVNDILTTHGFSGPIDVLSIDLDGVDWWIWNAITAAAPRIVIVEYNQAFGDTAAVSVPYRADFSRAARDADGRLIWAKEYWGASLAAFVALAQRKGYRLVATLAANAFFVRDDLATDTPAIATAEAFTPPANKKQLALALRIADVGVDAWFGRDALVTITDVM